MCQVDFDLHGFGPLAEHDDSSCPTSEDGGQQLTSESAIFKPTIRYGAVEFSNLGGDPSVYVDSVKKTPVVNPYPTDDDWSDYGDMPKQMADYSDAVARIHTYPDWSDEQKRLHELMFMRGHHPVLPSWWTVHFKMWQISLDCYAPVDSLKKVAIRSVSPNEMSAARALEDLFNLTHTVADYMVRDGVRLSGKTIVRALRKYVRWAYQDAGIEDYANAEQIILIQQYPPNFGMGDFNEQDPSDRQHQEDDPEEFAELTEDERAAERKEVRRAKHFGQALDAHMKARLQELAARWQRFLTDPETKQVRMPVPTLYVFAVVAGNVLISSWNPSGSSVPSTTASRPKGDGNDVIGHDTVELDVKDQWLVNALGIALTVHQARDALLLLYDGWQNLGIPDQDA